VERIEKEAVKLAEAFSSFYKEYSYPLYRRNTLKKSKWWKFFFRAADMYSNLKDWDAYIWVACQFEKHGKRFPPQLVGQEAFDTFQEYKHRFREKKSSSLVRSLIDTYKKILDWSVETGNDPSLFLTDKKNLFLLERGEINSAFFVVSKSFIALDEEIKNKIISKEEFMTKRAMILNNDRLKNKMMEILGEDFT
jgi:hypothetical protein